MYNKERETVRVTFVILNVNIGEKYLKRSEV